MSAQSDALDKALADVSVGISDIVAHLAAARDNKDHLSFLEDVAAKLTQLSNVLVSAVKPD